MEVEERDSDNEGEEGGEEEWRDAPGICRMCGYRGCTRCSYPTHYPSQVEVPWSAGVLPTAEGEELPITAGWLPTTEGLMTETAGGGTAATHPPAPPNCVASHSATVARIE